MPNPSSSSPSPLLPAPAAAARGRRRRLLASHNPASSTLASGASSSSSSSSSSSASSHLSFPYFSPAPSPFHHRFFLSPLRASAVPFSWEHRPGIPKTPARVKPGAKPPPLPLPPSLFSNRVVAEAMYPFASAPGDDDDCFIVSENSVKTRRRRIRPPPPPQQRPRWPALTDWLAVLSPYRSCTRSRDCLAAAPSPARSGVGRPTHARTYSYRTS